MKEIDVIGQKRSETGKKASKLLRKEGLIPCNLYGEAKNENGLPKAMSFAVSMKELRKIVYTPHIYVINLVIDGESHTAIMKELQFHPVTDSLLHIDFYEINDQKPITIGMILLGFILAFVPAIPIMMLGGAISSLGQVVAGALAQAGAPDVLGSFLAGVVFNSLCFGTMMVGYVFGINLVFGLYEEAGYMARISYVFDHTMARFGLQGKSLMPFLMCLGCTMGGVSGSRVIDSWGQRMLTVMMAWAIPCGSTWGVVPVLAVAFFGVAGAPLVIVGIFAVTILIMWLVGRVFGPRLVAEGERAGMVMELPPYHRPHLGNVARGALLKSRQMFVRAIRVVALFAFAIWALTYTATGSVEGSVLYALGTAIEPVTRFFGMGWQTFTAWLCALVLKESALGVLSGLFTGAATPNAVLVGVMTGGAAAASNIGEVMAQAISAPEALAFIFAFTFNMPCAASVSATWGEVHSTKWTVITAAFYICCSLLLGCVVYHVSSLCF